MPKSSKSPSQRQLRVGEQLRHLLAEALVHGHVRDPELRDASITVTEVRVSPDLKNATAFVMPLAGREQETVLAALRRAAPFFRRELAQASGLRFAPRIGFQVDRSFDEAARIDALLRGERVRRDLEAGEGETQTEDEPDDEKERAEDTGRAEEEDPNGAAS